MSLQMTPSHQATSDKPPAALVVGTQFTVWAGVDGVCAMWEPYGHWVDPKWHAYNVSAYCYHKKLAHRHLIGTHWRPVRVWCRWNQKFHTLLVHRGPSVLSHWQLGLRSVRDDNAGTGYFYFTSFIWQMSTKPMKSLKLPPPFGWSSFYPRVTHSGS